jgi:transcriptional regulator with XRE-family HTH domain
VLQNFARNLRRFRQDAGLSQARLARKARLPQQYVSALERGLQPTDESHVLRLSRALGATPDALLASYTFIRIDADDHNASVPATPRSEATA